MKVSKLSNIFVIIFIFNILINVPITLASPQLEYEYENEGWILEYGLSNFQGEPGEVIIFTIEIFPKKDSYDLRINIESEYLTIEKKFQESNLYWSTIKQGQPLTEQIDITIPERANIGDIYEIKITATSHSNERIFNLRLPTDAPEYVFESTSKPEYKFNLYVRTYPILNIIEPFLPSLQTGKIGEFKIIIENSGNGEAHDIDYELQVPDSLKIHGSITGHTDDIPANSQIEIIFQIEPLEAGTHDCRFIITSINHQTMSQDIQIDSQNWYGTFILPIIFIIILIAFFIWRNRQRNNLF